MPGSSKPRATPLPLLMDSTVGSMDVNRIVSPTQKGAAAGGGGTTLHGSGLHRM